MKRFFFAILAILLLPGLAVFAADNPPPVTAGTVVPVAPAANPPPATSTETFLRAGNPANIYAFPGKDCPPGSHIYKGPEEAEIAKINYVYCRFNREYTWIEKTRDTTKCPDGSDPVPGGVKDDTIIWCKLKGAIVSSNGYLLNAEDYKKSAKAGAAAKNGPIKGRPTGNDNQ